MHLGHVLNVNSTQKSGSTSATDVMLVPLIAKHVLEIAKEVVLSTSLVCSWGRCHAELNSWKSLQEVWYCHISTRLSENAFRHWCHFAT